MQGISRLEELWLGGNDITDQGASVLAHAIGPASRAAWTVSRLALYSNAIDDQGLLELARAADGRARLRESQEQQELDGLWSPGDDWSVSPRVCPPLSVLMFGHRSSDDEIASLVLSTPGCARHIKRRAMACARRFKPQ